MFTSEYSEISTSTREPSIHQKLVFSAKSAALQYQVSGGKVRPRGGLSTACCVEP